MAYDIIILISFSIVKKNHLNLKRKVLLSLPLLLLNQKKQLLNQKKQLLNQKKQLLNRERRLLNQKKQPLNQKHQREKEMLMKPTTNLQPKSLLLKNQDQDQSLWWVLYLSVILRRAQKMVKMFITYAIHVWTSKQKPLIGRCQLTNNMFSVHTGLI